MASEKADREFSSAREEAPRCAIKRGDRSGFAKGNETTRIKIAQPGRKEKGRLPQIFSFPPQRRAGGAAGAQAAPLCHGVVEFGGMLRVIVNPAAGPAMAGKIGRMRQVLASRGVPFEIAETGGPNDAVLLAREAAHAGAAAVIAAGGDGTVNEVANGLAKTECRMLIVPHGTGNVIAQELGIPREVDQCIDLLDTGRTVSIPLARAGERYFLLMGSAGFDAEVIEGMGSCGKKALGRAAYVVAGVRHLLRSQPTLWIELPERERIEVQLVLFCRGRRYAAVEMVPDGDLEKKAMRMLALRRAGRLSILSFALDILRGRHLDSPHVIVRQIDSVLVRSRIRSAAQVDGEYLGPLPVRFVMTDATVRVVVPPAR